MIVDVFSAVADVSSAYLSLEGRSEGCSNRLYSGNSTDPVWSLGPELVRTARNRENILITIIIIIRFVPFEL